MSCAPSLETGCY